MRLAVISDIHGNVVALRHVLAHMRNFGVDGIVNLGDCVTAPLWPRETLDLLDTLDIPTVRGNHDRWLTDTSRSTPVIEFTRAALTPEQCGRVASLPQTRTLDDVFLCHGTPASDTEYLLEDSVHDRLCSSTADQIRERILPAQGSLVLCGHSHHQSSALVDGKLVLNPGSVGCPRYAGNESPKRNEAGSPHARYAIVTLENGRWSADLFVLAYDWSVVAQRAIDRGFPEWAWAFAKD